MKMWTQFWSINGFVLIPPFQWNPKRNPLLESRTFSYNWDKKGTQQQILQVFNVHVCWHNYTHLGMTIHNKCSGSTCTSCTNVLQCLISLITEINPAKIRTPLVLLTCVCYAVSRVRFLWVDLLQARSYNQLQLNSAKVSATKYRIIQDISMQIVRERVLSLLVTYIDFYYESSQLAPGTTNYSNIFLLPVPILFTKNETIMFRPCPRYSG